MGALLALSAAYALAPATFAADKLPDLKNAADGNPASLQASPNGLTLQNNGAGSRLSGTLQTSQHAGSSIGLNGALSLGEAAVLGGGLQGGPHLKEAYANLGLRLGDHQRLILSAAQLQQDLEIDFPSGRDRADLTQNAAGLTWRMQLSQGLLDHAELTAYHARTGSRDLADVGYAIDTASLYELWNDPRRIAGGKVSGAQARLGLNPWQGGGLTLGLGQENLEYDLQGGGEKHQRSTASLGLEQQLGERTRLKFVADAAAAQTRYSLDLAWRLASA